MYKLQTVHLLGRRIVVNFMATSFSHVQVEIWLWWWHKRKYQGITNEMNNNPLILTDSNSNFVTQVECHSSCLGPVCVFFAPSVSVPAFSPSALSALSLAFLHLSTRCPAPLPRFCVSLFYVYHASFAVLF